MAVNNGQDASEEILNDAFLSRTTNTSTTGKLDLRNADSADVEDVQGKINELLSGKNSSDTKNAQQDARLDSLESSLPLSNFNAAVEPAASNDTAEGYSLGSYWYNAVKGHLYICTDAAEDAALWNDINVVKIKDWTATTKYLQNETVLNDGVIYRAIATFTSGATFDEGNWEAIGAAGGGGGGSLSTFYSETFEEFTDGSEFPCLDGGTIGGGTLITSFVSIEETEPLAGDKSIKFTIPSSGTGKYCLIHSSLQIPVPRYARNGKCVLRFVADGTADYGDISLFLWDTTNGETIKDKDGNTLFINPRANIGNTLYFNTNGTEALQWGAYINRDNTGATLVIDNVEIQGNPDKNIDINRVVQSLSRSGNDGRAITANVESIPFGTGTDSANGWTYGADGSSPTTGNYYSVKSSNSVVSFSSGILSDATALAEIVLFKNGMAYRRISGHNSADGNHKAVTFISELGEFSKGDKLAIVSPVSFTLGTASSYHYLNIVETASSNNVIVAGTNDKLALESWSLGVSQNIGTAWENLIFDTPSSNNVGNIVSYNTGTGVFNVSRSGFYLPTIIANVNTLNNYAYIKIRNISDSKDYLYEYRHMENRQGFLNKSFPVFFEKGKDYAVQAQVDGTPTDYLAGYTQFSLVEFSSEELIYMYLQESNNRTSDGTEYMTTESIDGKPVYERVYRVASDITTDATVIDTIDTGLEVLDSVNYVTTYYNLYSSPPSQNNRSYITYDSSNGKIEAYLTVNKIGAGTTFKIRYTKP